VIKKFSYYLSFLRSLSFYKLLNLFKIYSSYYLAIATKKTNHKGQPWSLSIETGTFCNLSCLECPSGQKQFTRPTGQMDIENFKTIIDKQKKSLIWLILYFQGEPFLNKDFFSMVTYARENKIFTSTSTNGHFLNPQNAEKAVQSGLHRIIISLDGLDQQTYEKYRVGGNFSQVINGIKNLVAAKKRLQSATPFIVVQFIVFKTNEHQLSKVQKLKKDLKVDKLEIKTAQVYSSEDKNKLIPDNKKLRRYEQTTDGNWKLKGQLPNKCKRMWRSAVITWDGQVIPCCFDKDADYKMGNLLTSSFQEIKTSPPYSAFREQILSDRSQIDICKNCSEGI